MSNASGDKNGIFPTGDRAPADYFTGTAWVHSLVGKSDIFNCTVANVVFEPGCRNNWHNIPADKYSFAQKEFSCLTREMWCR